MASSSASPQDWALDNVGWQGQTIRQTLTGTPSPDLGGNLITIAGITYLSFDVGCCGGFERVYITSLPDTQGANHIYVFLTRLPTGDSWLTGHHILLDAILYTLRRK